MKQKAKHGKKRRSAWKRASRPFGAGDWLCLCAMAAVIAALAWVGARLLPARDAASVPPSVVINRVMTANPSVCYSVRGEYYDWVELLNASDQTVSLAGWRFSDSIDQRGAFAFGDIALPPGGTLIVYCDDAPEDYDGGEVFCGFRLDADGELLALSDARLQLVQALDVPAMAATDVYRRDESGEYAAVPFAALAARGAVDLRPPFDPDGVIINEVMASNRVTLRDEDGDWPDWIELYNGSAAPVDLTGWALSDDDANQRKWVFPALTLQPGEYRLVYASGKDRRTAEALHTGFKLSSRGEGLRLYDPAGNVLSWVEYADLPVETSLSRLADGGFTTELRPTPGHENSEAGARAALTLAGENPLGLYINEIMSTGEGQDWIELYNANGKAVDLTGMGLSDNTDHPRRWQFPEGALIPANGYATVLLTGAGGASGIQNGRYCADFGLSAGETAVLAQPDGALIDRVTLFECHRDVSYGRAGGHERYRYFTEPTPGAPNAAESFERKAAEVTFSVPGGQHSDKTLTVALAADPDATIYYTTDGSEPTTSSKVYGGPLELKKNAVIKAVAWRQDVIPSDLAVQSYLLGVEHTVRVVSVSGDSAKLDGSTGMLKTGIKGVGSEAYVEVYEPDGTRVIAQKCLMKLAGHSSRKYEAQKGFSLRARKEYGVSRFNYPLFSNRDYDSYKSFVLRASGQDCRQTFMRDSILSALAADTTVLYRETEVSVVYVNGRYWGVYNMRERISDDMIAQYEGWNKEDVQIAQGKAWSNGDFQQMLAWVADHDLSDDANLQQLRRMVDVENYLEYVALEMYVNNQDLNNVAAYRNKTDGGRWRWALFDLDLSYQLAGDNVEAWLKGDTVGTITEQNNLLFKKLMRNASARDWFLRRMGQLLATAFTTENVVGKVKARYAVLEPEMAAECKRWDWSLATWRRYGNRLVAYARTRPANLIGYLKDNFHLSDAQAQDYFGDALAKIETE